MVVAATGPANRLIVTFNAGMTRIKLRSLAPAAIGTPVSNVEDLTLALFSHGKKTRIMECAPDGGWELTGAAGLSEDESHGQAPHP